ncbi:MAG: 1-deoxy-D-xylulose-5-phosphate synthase, partial [Bacteroidales bacterium]|nr:1-deoxy-D-xylulose-5-phosphate synthase [Bacteroidales bacterium]
AFEGLNNAGVSNSNLLVILNDNGISIDKSTGALSRYFTKIVTSRRYNNVKDRVWDRLGKNETGKGARHALSRMTGALKSLFFKQGNLFEALDFRYFGPMDGHDLPTLIRTLEALKRIQGPKLLHIVTTKGKGMKTAEAAPTLFHAPGRFDSQTGEIIKPGINLSLAPRYQDVFGKTIIELARLNPRIVGITPAMPTGCSLNLMMKKMPERTFDVGIAEQHAVTFSAGLAAAGLIPFCNIYSSFMQRAYDQVIHDVALQQLPVVFCLDRAGIVGEDGATHHGAFDLACLRPIPNLTIASPLNERELRNLMFTAQSGQYGTFVIRYPRGRGVTPRWKTPLELLPPGQGQTLREGRRIAFVCLGHIGNTAIAATREYLRETGADWTDATQGPGLFNMIYLKPLDTALLNH